MKDVSEATVKSLQQEETQPSWPPVLDFPENLNSLHEGEEELYGKSVSLVAADKRMLIHVNMIERVMDMTDTFRQYPTEDEDLKVIQMCALRLFNAFASSYKLMMSGYYQKSAMIMRDILEVVFLLDLFRTDRAALTKWRLADKKTRKQEFKPVKVREALDKRDGFTGKKRADMYEMLSELAAHVNMGSTIMLRPKGMDARNGPFLDPSALGTTLDEMGRLAIQAGEILNAFFPSDWAYGTPIQKDFQVIKKLWIETFYPKTRTSS